MFASCIRLNFIANRSSFVGHQSFSIIPICIHASLFRMQNTWGWLVNTRHPGSLREEGVL